MSARGQAVGRSRARNQPGMRKISLIAVHCSATVEGRPFTADDIRGMHTRPKPRGNGWSTIGYHSILELDGKTVLTLPVAQPGIHIKGHNAHSLSVCYIGGIGKDGKSADTRTPAQIDAMARLLRVWRHTLAPDAPIRGHRDLSPDADRDGKVERHEWLKDCPCFDVQAWCQSVGIDPK